METTTGEFCLARGYGLRARGLRPRPGMTASLPLKLRHDLNMRRMAKLIHWRQLGHPIAPVHQDAGVAGEGRRIARHRDDALDLRSGKLARLRFGALARRIEHHGVEALELRGGERAAEQIARLGLDRLEPGRGR